MKRLIALGIFGGFLFFSLIILAQVPQLLNYQGRLTDDKRIPIITTTTVRFSLYQGGDAATPGSGTLCYQEDASVTPDDNGVFSHLIGSGTVIYGALDSTVFQTFDPVYLEITIDPSGANETLLPRKQIVTVGYSFKAELADDADTVDGQDASAFAPVVHNHDPDYVNEGQANSVNSAMIVNGTIMDADINASASIAGSKIDPTGLDADLLDGKDSSEFVHTAGDDMTGTLNVNTATLYALYGATTSTSGRAVFGQAPYIGVYGYASATGGISYGVEGSSFSTNGRGVYGYASANSGNTYGVYGESMSTSGKGVFGYASASSGTTYGVYGTTNSASGYAGYFQGNAHVTGDLTVGGVLDADLLDGEDSLDFVHTVGDDMTGTLDVYTQMQYALIGATLNTGGRGVYGVASATSGTTYGVYGINQSTSGGGVSGEAWATSGTTYGVHGQSDSTSGRGVYGEATAISGVNNGVEGSSFSTDGRGVCGYASNDRGTNYGVYGKSNSTSGYGVYGAAPYTGVFGYASATSGSTIGVYGKSNSASGYAGYFEGNTHVTGNLTVDGTILAQGVKPCVQPIDNGKKVLLYAMESPEIWFEDFGSAKLVNGQAVVPIERVFAQTANTEIGYFVFPIPNGECSGLYISHKHKDSFEVRELGGGTSNITFDYRIVAKRRGYEEVRFEEFTEPEKSPQEPNLPIEPKKAKVKEPKRQ